MSRRRRYNSLLLAVTAVLASACSSTPAQHAGKRSPSVTTSSSHGTTTTVVALVAPDAPPSGQPGHTAPAKQLADSPPVQPTPTTAKAGTGSATTTASTITSAPANGPKCPNPKTCELHAFMDNIAKGWRPHADGIARIPFYVNTKPPDGSTLLPQKIYDAFEEGTTIWEAGNPRIDFQLVGTTGDRLQRRGDGFSDFAYGAAVEWRRDADGYLIEVDIIRTPLDPGDSLAYTPCDWKRDNGCNMSNSGKLEIVNLIVHELGHVVGLSDLTDTIAEDLTMYRQTRGVGDRRSITLGKGDLIGLHHLYPCNCLHPPIYVP